MQSNFSTIERCAPDSQAKATNNAQAALHGVLPVRKGRFETLQQSAMHWDNRLRQAMAVCNGLVLINKTVVGMDLERNMFKAVEARFLVRPCLSCCTLGETQCLWTSLATLAASRLPTLLADACSGWFVLNMHKAAEMLLCSLSSCSPPKAASHPISLLFQALLTSPKPHCPSRRQGNFAYLHMFTSVEKCGTQNIKL